MGGNIKSHFFFFLNGTREAADLTSCNQPNFFFYKYMSRNLGFFFFPWYFLIQQSSSKSPLQISLQIFAAQKSFFGGGQRSSSEISQICGKLGDLRGQTSPGPFACESKSKRHVIVLQALACPDSKGMQTQQPSGTNSLNKIGETCSARDG